MSENPRIGQTASAPVHILPRLEWDMSEGQTLPADLGETWIPVTFLPEQSFDLQPSLPVLTLQLKLHLRDQTPPGELALDLFRLYTAVNRLELSQARAGLTPYDASCDLIPTGGTMRVSFTPIDPTGAAERLTTLAETINGTVNFDGFLGRPAWCITRCEAQVVGNGA